MGLYIVRLANYSPKLMGQGFKMDSWTVSHYSKKLEKYRFVICTTLQQNSERKIFPRQDYVQKFYKVAWGFYDKLDYLDAAKYKKTFLNDPIHRIIQNMSNFIVFSCEKDDVKDEYDILKNV